VQVIPCPQGRQLWLTPPKTGSPNPNITPPARRSQQLCLPRLFATFLGHNSSPSCADHSAPPRPLTPAYPTKNRFPKSEYNASRMSIAKTVPPPPVSDFLGHNIPPSCAGHSAPPRPLTPAYPTQTKFPQSYYDASCMLIAKMMPPPPVSGFLGHNIPPSCAGHSAPPRPLTPAYPTKTKFFQSESNTSCILITPPRPVSMFFPITSLAHAQVVSHPPGCQPGLTPPKNKYPPIQMQCLLHVNR
jgi:hypothetical protein